MPESHHVVKPSLSFAKLVATPTENAWSQAYNAGNLFACVSLLLNEPTEGVSLPVIGKECLSILESEFFSLEEKTTETIKKAIIASLEKIPPGIQANITLADYKDTVLTVFIAGSGKVVLKRGEKIGILLEKNIPYDADDITSASGYVENNDTVILQSGQFAQGISKETVASALELALPTDIVEALSPQVHEQDNGSQAAIVVTFHGNTGTSHSTQTKPSDQELEPTVASLYDPEESESTEQEEEYDEDEETDDKPKESILSKFHLPKLPKLRNSLSHKRKLYLTIAVILAALLATSIYLAVKKQSDEKQQAVFQSVYTTAQQYFDEGQGLESLNKSLSQDSYLKAQNKLKEADGKIQKGSSEDRQIQELASKIQNALQTTSTETATDAKEATVPANSLLAVEKENPSGLGFGQDTNMVYIITDTTISSVAKSNDAKKELVKNDSTWTSPKAIVPYQGNLYVLDQKNGVLKFVPSSNTYTKTNYFTGTPPVLTQATGMAIDGSIWIVTQDGKILKFTRGQKDSFSITGLDKPLSKPTKISTSLDMDSVYILDPGSSRVIQLDKKGAFIKAFSSSTIAKAIDFEVSENDKKIFILSGSKTYELPL